MVALRVVPAPSQPARHRSVARDKPPPIDRHLVKPEGRQEVLRGRRLTATPALAPHGDAHGELGFAVRGLARPGYVVSTDLLTRVSQGSDFATDTSVRKAGVDPATGERHLEELSFEVVFTQPLSEISERAEDLVARGVRRVFAVFVKRNQVAEWSPDAGQWRDIPRDAAIEDECLVRPLPVRALLEAAENETAVARALLAKKNPALEQVRQQSFHDGLAKGLRQAVVRFCRRLDVELTPARRAALEHMDAGALEDLLDRIDREGRWPA